MLTLIAKEWRRFLRKPSTPWLVAAFVVVPVLAAAALLRGMSSQTAGPQPMQALPALGGYALSVIGTWQVLLLAILAPWLGAGLIAGELEDRTLEPLLAGGQRPLGVAGAKLLALVSFLLLVVLAGLPVFTLAFLAGGVNMLLVGRVVLMEAATAIGMSGVGLALSALGRRTGSLAVTGVALALLLTLGTGMADQYLPGAGGSGAYGKSAAVAPGMVGNVVTIAIVAGRPVGATVPPWLQANPLVGLNSALGQSGGQGLFLFGLPGAGAPPVYKSVLLWHAQAAGAVAVALLGLLITWGILSARLRWRWPLRRKEVPANA